MIANCASDVQRKHYHIELEDVKPLYFTLIKIYGPPEFSDMTNQMICQNMKGNSEKTILKIKRKPSKCLVLGWK